jgi:polyhydroxyalkanoate synthesis regulator phasin
MTKESAYQRYLDAGLAFTQMTRARAEELVKDLASGGDLQRQEAQAKVEELVERGRQSSEALLAVVREEVVTQLRSMGIGSVEDLATQVATVLGRSAATVKQAAKKAPAKAKAARATTAKKAPAKKAPAKKAPAKKAPAKKAPAKKAPAKKAATSGSEG